MRQRSFGGRTYYNKRYYDPTIGRFIQPDTIISSYASPQTLNRFSYVVNNPILLNDPSGHREACGAHAQDCEDDQPVLKPNTHSGDDSVRERHSNKEMPSLPIPDAGYSSFSMSAGIGPLYGLWGIDVVQTDDEIGIFSVYSLGPGFENKISTLPSTIRTDQMEKTWMTPQIGVALNGGYLWGPSVRQDVRNYEGVSKIGGLSVGPVAAAGAEYFESVEKYSGRPNGQIKGAAVSLGVGAVPIEGHLIYAKAVYEEQLSWMATTVHQLQQRLGTP